MKPHKPGSRRKKIILYYTLAGVLPGIVLGYMAYRGMSNDQALREKESRRKLEINSQAFFSAIDSSFVRFINKQTTDSMLSVTGTGDPSLLAFFIRDSSVREYLRQASPSRSFRRRANRFGKCDSRR